jgi:hypothetical protein
VDSLKFLVPVRQATPHCDMGGSFRKLGHYDTLLPMALPAAGATRRPTDVRM